MLVFGGIPWNCYFQRVLSCQTPADARAHSIFAGLLTMAFTAPPLLLGMASVLYPWSATLAAEVSAEPSRALPMLFQHAVPPVATMLGLGAIIAAVTSSFSASILSAGSMFAWNAWHRLVRPDLDAAAVARLIRGSVVALGAGAALMALEVRSVQALWFFTSDLVFALLFPQLVAALFDPRANTAGSVVAFAVSMALRLGAGEPLLHVPALIPYPEGFPFRTVAAAAGLVLLPLVSRATASWCRPRPLEAHR
jgi:high affinity choline transporter 7